jgi:hypothetical protein
VVTPLRSHPRLVPALLALPTILLSLWVIFGWRFNGLYGQDPYTYYGYGVGPLRAFLLSGKQLTAMNWPLGYPFLVTLASLIFGTAPAAGQLVSVVAGAAAVPLTYLLAHEVLIQAGAERELARRAAIIAAALMGVTGWLVQASVTIMADSVGLTTALLSAWALLRWSQVDGSASGAGWLALAGGALAWSIVTRWGQALLVPVWLLAALPAIRSRPSRFARAVPAAVLAGGAVLAAQAWLILTVEPHPSLSSLPFAGDITLVRGARAGGGWSLAHLFQRDFLNPDGSQRYSLPNLVYYASAPFRPQDLSPFFAPPALLGALLAVARYRRSVPLLLIWPATLLLFDAGLAEQNLRFVLPALPPVAILAGLGIAATRDWVSPRRRSVLAEAVLLGLVAVAAWGLRDVGKLVDEHNAELDVARWTALKMPPNATLLTFGITLTVDQATRLRPLDLFAVSRPRLAWLVAHVRPLYLLVQVDQMNGQWRLRSPGTDYRYLRDGPGLTEIGPIRGYTLFRVHSV